MGNSIYKSLDTNDIQNENGNGNIKYKGDIITENRIKNIKHNNKTKNEKENLEKLVYMETKKLIMKKIQL